MGCLMLSAERYLVIVKKRALTAKEAALALVVIWLMGFIHGTVPFWFSERYVLQALQLYCCGDWAGTSVGARFLTLLCFVILSTAMFGCIFLYWKIFAVVRANTRQWTDKALGVDEKERRQNASAKRAQELEAKIAFKVRMRVTLSRPYESSPKLNSPISPPSSSVPSSSTGSSTISISSSKPRDPSKFPTSTTLSPSSLPTSTPSAIPFFSSFSTSAGCRPRNMFSVSRQKHRVPRAEARQKIRAAAVGSRRIWRRERRGLRVVRRGDGRFPRRCRPCRYRVRAFPTGSREDGINVSYTLHLSIVLN